jgi:tetratricopeptide (TPR) repeat protein
MLELKTAAADGPDARSVRKLNARIEELGKASRFSAATSGIGLAILVGSMAIATWRLEIAEKGVATKRVELEKAQKALAVTLDERRELTTQNANLEATKDVLAAQVDALAKQKDDMLAAVEGARTLKDAQSGVQNAAKSPRERAMILWKQGFAAYNAGRLIEAGELYERSHDTDPKYAPALNSLGNMAYEKGDFGTADALYAQALALEPDYAPGVYNRALIAKNQGRMQDALLLAKQALTVRPGYQPAVALKRDLEATPH